MFGGLVTVECQLKARTMRRRLVGRGWGCDGWARTSPPPRPPKQAPEVNNYCWHTIYNDVDLRYSAHNAIAIVLNFATVKQFNIVCEKMGRREQEERPLPDFVNP